jgi:predicted alpha/beta-hydrolase family hydrolase
VTLLWERPEGADAAFVFAHGAGAGMRHAFMTALSAALAARRIATARYEFPYMARGERRIDPANVLQQCVRDAVAEAAASSLPLFAGGKSMGGRMTSQADAESPLPVGGLIFAGFPLHPAKAPATKRAGHLAQVRKPMLFLQGTRDELADLSLLEPIVRSLPTAELHVVDGADHAFHVLKRSGRTDAQVLDELADAVRAFVDRVNDTFKTRRHETSGSPAH